MAGSAAQSSSWKMTVQLVVAAGWPRQASDPGLWRGWRRGQWWAWRGKTGKWRDRQAWKSSPRLCAKKRRTWRVSIQWKRKTVRRWQDKWQLIYNKKNLETFLPLNHNPFHNLYRVIQYKIGRGKIGGRKIGNIPFIPLLSLLFLFIYRIFIPKINRPLSPVVCTASPSISDILVVAHPSVLLPLPWAATLPWDTPHMPCPCLPCALCLAALPACLCAA